MHTLNNNLYWMANKCLTFVSYSQDEYILFSVYIIAYNELHIYNVWTSSVIMIYIHVWFDPEYTQINTKSMLQKYGVFSVWVSWYFYGHWSSLHYYLTKWEKDILCMWLCTRMQMWFIPCLASFSPFFSTLSINNTSNTWEQFIKLCLLLKCQIFLWIKISWCDISTYTSYFVVFRAFHNKIDHSNFS